MTPKCHTFLPLGVSGRHPSPPEINQFAAYISATLRITYFCAQLVLAIPMGSTKTIYASIRAATLNARYLRLPYGPARDQR